MNTKHGHAMGGSRTTYIDEERNNCYYFSLGSFTFFCFAWGRV
uniref:Uncharacterized protein n=1 Tax=Rhizophora mucronata TaxID=61149 RepID=A0A2P2PEL6_RHIMU